MLFFRTCCVFVSWLDKITVASYLVFQIKNWTLLVTKDWRHRIRSGSFDCRSYVSWLGCRDFCCHFHSFFSVSLYNYCCYSLLFVSSTSCIWWVRTEGKGAGKSTDTAETTFLGQTARITVATSDVFLKTVVGFLFLLLFLDQGQRAKALERASPLQIACILAQ